MIYHYHMVLPCGGITGFNMTYGNLVRVQQGGNMMMPYEYMARVREQFNIFHAMPLSYAALLFPCRD